MTTNETTVTYSEDETTNAVSKARDAWEHARAEREHAFAMSERESALRHEEEPEPPAFSTQTNNLSKLTDGQILHLIEECLIFADERMPSYPDYADYFLKRAQALSAYIVANNSRYTGRSSAE